jgi:hypothetical protein
MKRIFLLTILLGVVSAMAQEQPAPNAAAGTNWFDNSNGITNAGVNLLAEGSVDALRYGLFTYHGMVGATIDSVKRLNRDVSQDRNDSLFPDANSSRLSGISTAHRT